MKISLEKIINSHNKLLQFFLVLLFSFIVSLLIPNNISFSFNIEKGSIWNHDDLYSEHDFSIIKTESQKQKQKDQIIDDSYVYYQKDYSVEEEILGEFTLKIDKEFKSNLFNNRKIDDIKNRAESTINDIYSNGIINLRKIDTDRDLKLMINELDIDLNLDNYFNINTAKDFIKKELYDEKIEGILIDLLDYDIHYNEDWTLKMLEKDLLSIHDVFGLIEKDSLIIKKNQFINDDLNQKLYSYKESLGLDELTVDNYELVFLGRFLLIGVILFVLYFFLSKYYLNIISRNTNFIFLFSIIILFLFISFYLSGKGDNLIYLVPFCIIPITIRAFFDFRLALFVHFFTIIIASFSSSEPHLFILLHFLAGYSSLMTFQKIYIQSQLLLAIIRISIVYIFTFTSFYLILLGSFNEIDFYKLGLICIGSLLTFLSFPFIYISEKIFGLISDISLLEYGDTNRPLLRELAEKAPGTFHHSLQVSHLAESVAIELGANSLLVRAGALYHDIGKLKKPNFFIENQNSSYNPHDDLSFDESAQVIVDHVLDGIEIARSANLPDQLIDFIRTHHGNYLIQYFYKEYLKNYPNELVDDNKFRYPGPKPFNKETAILMMADSVEAASRSLKNPTNQNIDNIVEKVISNQLSDNQFDNSSLTFKDIKVVKNILKIKLRDIYHLRIKYPED